MLAKQLIRPSFSVAIILSFVTLLVTTLVSMSVFAVDGGSSTANTLKISPTRTDVSADPGETKVVKITVTNPSANDVKVKLIENDFKAGDEEGSPAIILDENKFAPSHSLKKFLKPLDSIDLAGKQSKTVELIIEVPKDAEAGGYFGALRFAPTSPDGGGQVNMSPSVASLVLLTVRGDTPEKLDLTNFEVQQNKKTGSWFTNSDNISLFLRFKNEGNVQLSPVGKISVKKGDKLIYDTDFNSSSQKDMILPDSGRRWQVPLKNINGFGKYTVIGTFTYGSKNKSLEVTSEFWIIPISVIASSAVGLVVVVGVIVYLVSRRRGKANVSFKK